MTPSIKIPREVVEEVYRAIFVSEKRFSAIDHESNDEAEVYCREALALLAPYLEGE